MTEAVPQELTEVAEHLCAHGLGEGVDFHVAGRPVPGGLPSDFGAARAVLVEHAVKLARSRWGSSILDEPRGTERRWWPGIFQATVPAAELEHEEGVRSDPMPTSAR